MKYKEGFSIGLVKDLIENVQPQSVLDPFAGIGTTPLMAAGKGLRGTGIELIPVGVSVGNAIAHASNGLDQAQFRSKAEAFLKRIASPEAASSEHSFPHVSITESPFHEIRRWISPRLESLSVRWMMQAYGIC